MRTALSDKKINIIKVDFLHTDFVERREIELLAKGYPNIALLAEKIETKHKLKIFIKIS